MYKIYILIAIIIFIYYMATINVNAQEDYMYGFWTADGDDFCQSAGIQSMMLFIGEPSKSAFSSRVSRECYIVILNDVANESFTLTYNRGWAGPVIGKYKLRGEIEFDGEEIWPGDVDISIDMRTGILRVTADGTLYARLHKQHDTTNLSRD